MVDDEVIIRTLVPEVLAEDGHEVMTVEDGGQAVDLLEQEHFDLVIVDIVMPVLNGVDVLLAARRIAPECPVIIITGNPSVSTAVRLINLGAADYITKPLNANAIRFTVAKVLELGRTSGADHQLGTSE